ncbi:CDP-alcohol phosphatidyltransferase family protein [Seongchinamella sediminis]|uniref:CDP-diacylglycerol--glycerol-3-phosphate 3-phosphatidyltransferase n=1 Tax=Seongchinamella sediminis TaxID=2283635 RepID=A0A3L7E138_9GAMM|nr:CDP-alcohol phosphatidyltransferase family protein [Seongchinamella sediminis]RLQ22659.1 CDP-alcohol phosphatidyltransferase family protein [Seongchinamella sediminis]
MNNSCGHWPFTCWKRLTRARRTEQVTLKYLPNALTISRLLLALPLGLLILRQEYGWALAVGFIAGATDALDGFSARKLGYFSRLGAALDPVADKLLILVTFYCLASTALIDWWLAAVVVGRDVVIVLGAALYRVLIGPFQFGATRLSKLNMAIQIAFCVLLLAAQLVAIPAPLLAAAVVVVVIIAVVSGGDYFVTWSRRAWHNRDRD